MGKLQTAVNLPKRILLQGWANDEGGVNINGEYTYTINFDISIIQGGPSILYNGYKHNTLNAFIYFIGEACEISYLCNWEFLTTADANQWDNPSTNPNVLPLTGWIENNAQGPAGTITILEDINTKISIKKQNTGAGKLTFDGNYILNSKFNADNQYPIADGSLFFDNNYYLQGNCGGEDTCTILTNYRHNSPLLYSPYEYDYYTIANRTFHEINAPYNTLPIGHPIQPRLLKMFGVGSKFGRTQNIRTIINTASYSVFPPDYTSWTKYGVEQIVKIPSWATKVVYGVKYLAKSDDLFRENNFAGLKLNFRLLDSPFSLITAYRNYVNIHLIRRSTAAAVDVLESLYGSNIYTYFNTSYSTAASNQWLGPNIGTVKVRKRSSTIIDSNTNQFIKIKDTIDIPTFSSSSNAPDLGDGRPDTVSLEMFFAEFVDYFVSSGPNGTPSGSIYFYEPFIYFV